MPRHWLSFAVFLLDSFVDHRTYGTIKSSLEDFVLHMIEWDGEDWSNNWAVGKQIGRIWFASDKISNKSGDVGGFIQPHFGVTQVTHWLYPIPANINTYMLYTLIIIDWTVTVTNLMKVCEPVHLRIPTRPFEGWTCLNITCWFAPGVVHSSTH